MGVLAVYDKTIQGRCDSRNAEKKLLMGWLKYFANESGCVRSVKLSPGLIAGQVVI